MNNVTITNVHIYNKTVINNVTVNRISYNGRHGGVNARPTHEQEMWGHEHHVEATNMQREHERGAGSNRAFLWQTVADGKARDKWERRDCANWPASGVLRLVGSVVAPVFFTVAFWELRERQ
jgi:hypothetical protein